MWLSYEGICKGQQHVAHGSERLLCTDLAQDSGSCIGIERLSAELSVRRLCNMLLPLTSYEGIVAQPHPVIG